MTNDKIEALAKKLQTEMMARESAERQVATLREALREIEWSNNLEWQRLRAQTALAKEPLDPHRSKDEIAQLRNEVERLTQERDEARAALQRRADELNVIQGSIAAYQAGTLEHQVATLREALSKVGNISHAEGDTAGICEIVEAALEETDEKDVD